MTTRLFLHSPSEAPDASTVAGRMPEFERLGERALLLAGPDDVVCLAHAVDGLYLRFLESLELGPRREHIVVVGGVRPGRGLSSSVLRDPDALDQVVRCVSGSETLVVCPFFPIADAFALGGVLKDRLSRPVRVEGGSAELARQLHDKIAARRLAQSLDIPVAPGEVVRFERAGVRSRADTAALRDAIGRWSRSTGNVIVRGASGASGSSIFTSRSDDLEAMIDAIARRTDNAHYLVEPLFEARFSPNVEVQVEPGVAPRKMVGVSEQVLDPDLVYTGSAYPSRAPRQPEMIEDALAIVAWMRVRGFTGRVGFDFVEHGGSGDGPRHFLTEINPRINGASYPLALLQHLAALARRRWAPAPVAFRTAFVHVRAREFGELVELAGALLYDPVQGEGVVPYAVGALASGETGIACFGPTAEAVEDLREQFLVHAGCLPHPSTSADAA